MTQHEAAATNGQRMLAPYTTTVRRVARVMTGSHEAGPALLDAVAQGLESLDERPHDERGVAREVWRLVAQHLLAAPSLSPADLPPRHDGDSPAQRLAPVLAALPSQLRLALALTHQGRLTIGELAAALQVEAVVAEGLLASAEARLVSLARALGDEIEAPPRPR